MPLEQKLILGLKYSSTILLPDKPKRKEMINELFRQITVRKERTQNE